jgi:hypothetical protein
VKRGGGGGGAVVVVVVMVVEGCNAQGAEADAMQM